MYAGPGTGREVHATAALTELKDVLAGVVSRSRKEAGLESHTFRHISKYLRFLTLIVVCGRPPPPACATPVGMQLRVSYIITAITSRLRRRRKRRTLEDLPLEVIKLIFRLACTEQSTGCALSQVSKQIRALSLSTRFHSVAILAGSTSRLRLFATTFEAVCIEAAMQNIPRPVVRHLCISSTLDYETGERFKGRVYMMCSSSGDGPTFLDRFGYHHAEYRDALATLFRRVGTSQLESLMIIGDLSLGEDGGRRAFLECLDGFPNLRELSVIGSRRPPFEWTPSAISSMAHASGPVNGPLYPALRRLLVVPRNDIEVGFKWWAQHAPQLEELHIIARCSTQSPDMKFVPDLVTNLCA